MYPRTVSMRLWRDGELPMDMPKAGIYLFSIGNRHLYVGRSNVLRKRYYRHFTSPSGACLAFLLARKKTKQTVRAYKRGSGGTRAKRLLLYATDDTGRRNGPSRFLFAGTGVGVC
jgi:hypothetical protein